LFCAPPLEGLGDVAERRFLPALKTYPPWIVICGHAIILGEIRLDARGHDAHEPHPATEEAPPHRGAPPAIPTGPKASRLDHPAAAARPTPLVVFHRDALDGARILRGLARRLLLRARAHFLHLVPHVPLRLRDGQREGADLFPVQGARLRTARDDAKRGGRSATRGRLCAGSRNSAARERGRRER
jgi:hypothetical protein